MSYVQAIFLSVLIASTTAVKWEVRAFLGEYPLPQEVHLRLDVRSDESLIASFIQEDNSVLRWSYAPNVSRDYKDLSRRFRFNLTKPAYYRDVVVKGTCASDKLFFDEKGGDGFNVSFALFNRWQGHQSRNKIGHDFTGFIGFGRNNMTDFKKVILRQGNTYCAANECEYFEGLGMWCDQISFSTNDSGADAFLRFYKGSVHFADQEACEYHSGDGWTFGADGFQFRNFKIYRGFIMHLSTTSEFLTVPKPVLDYIVKVGPCRGSAFLLQALNATWWEREGVYLVDAKYIATGDSMIFRLNSKDVTVNPLYYITKFYGDTAILKIQESPNGEWTVGEPFTDAVGVCLDFTKKLFSFHKVPILHERRTITESFSKRELLPNGILRKRNVIRY